MDSPRGRIALIRGAADGRIDNFDVTDGLFRQHIDRCLGCRACETACPSGVQYGKLLEVARTTIEEQRKPSPSEQAIRDINLRQLLPHPSRLRWMARLLWLAQLLGLPQLATKLSFLPIQLRTMAGILPPLDIRTPDYSQPAPAVGSKRGKVAFFRGCVQDAFLSGTNAATVRVLQRNGFEVHFPAAQTCCGAAGLHIGEHELALTLARQNIDAFASSDYVAIINNAGGCGATLKEYAWLLKDDPAYAEKAKDFVARSKDINEFLAENLHTAPSKADQPARGLCRFLPSAPRSKGGETTAPVAAIDPRSAIDRTQAARDVLRQCWRLQHHAVRNCQPGARRQDRRCHRRPPRHHRHRQHRLPHADDLRRKEGRVEG